MKRGRKDSLLPADVLPRIMQKHQKNITVVVILRRIIDGKFILNNTRETAPLSFNVVLSTFIVLLYLR